MRISRILYLILLSSIVDGCSSAYKDLVPGTGDTGCMNQFIPDYQKNWFSASVDVTGHHLSGLVIFKKMPEGAERIVFTNEIGVSFFDFEFSDSAFHVIQIIDKLNRQSVINTLRQDFELLLLRGLETDLVKMYKSADEYLYSFPHEGKLNYIVTREPCSGLSRLERGSARKKLVQIEFGGSQQDPDSIVIQHFNFNMRMILTKIER